MVQQNLELCVHCAHPQSGVNNAHPQFGVNIAHPQTGTDTNLRKTLMSLSVNLSATTHLSEIAAVSVFEDILEFDKYRIRSKS